MLNLGGEMRKLAIILTATVAMLFAGLLAWNADATTVSGAVTIGAKTYSPIVEETGCRSNAPLVGAAPTCHRRAARPEISIS